MMMTIDHWIEMSHLLQVYKIRLDFITLSLGLRFLSVCSVYIVHGLGWWGDASPLSPLDLSLTIGKGIPNKHLVEIVLIFNTG